MLSRYIGISFTKYFSSNGKATMTLSQPIQTPNQLITQVTRHQSTSIIKIYMNGVETYPLLVKGITSGILSGSADIICQLYFPPAKIDIDDSISQKQDIDIGRVVRFSSLGALFIAPSLHFWYGFLSRKFPNTGTLNTIIRLALDQLFFAPAFIASIFSLLLILDGKTLSDIHKKLEADLLNTIKVNFTVWIPAQFINFKLVPPHLQVLFANFVGFFWNIYLSYTGNKDVPPVKVTELVEKNDKSNKLE